MFIIEKSFITPNKYFFSLENVAKETWFVIHTIAASETGTGGGSGMLGDLMSTLRIFFTCSICRKHINEYLDQNKITTFEDTLIFHNVVNKRLGKPILEDFNAFRRFTENPVEDGEIGSGIFFEKKVGLEGLLYNVLITYINSKFETSNFILKMISPSFEKDKKFNSFAELFDFICDYYFPFGNNIFKKENSEIIFAELNYL